MTKSQFKWQCVFSTDDALEAHIIQGLLDQANIQSKLTGMALQGALGEIPYEQTSISILVFKIKVGAAKQILINYTQSQLGDEWYCDVCNEVNGPAFQSCWQCGNENDKSE